MSILTSFVEKALRTTVFEYSPQVTTTARPGVAYPVISFTVLPSDSFSFTPHLRVDSLPLQSPLLSSMDARLAFFYLPWRALVPRMKMDIAGIDTATVEFPQYMYNTYVDYNTLPGALSTRHAGLQNAYVASNSLGSFLHNVSRYFNCYSSDFTPPDGSTLEDWCNKYACFEGFSYAMYYMIMYYYYLNRQLAYFPMFVSETNEAIQVAGSEWVPTSEESYAAQRNALLGAVRITDLEDAIMAWSMGNFKYTKGSPGSVYQSYNVLNVGWFSPLYNYIPDNNVGVVAPAQSGYTAGLINTFRDLSGLVCITNSPDMLTAYTSSQAGMNMKSFSVPVSDGKVFIDDIITVNALRKFTALGTFSAPGYRDWIYSQFGVTIPADETRPVYLGSVKLGINFNAVIATSSDGLGDLAGRSAQGTTGKHRRFNFEDFGTFMAIFSIRANLGYTNPDPLDKRVRTLQDVEVPVKQTMPWQPLHLSQLCNSNSDYYQESGGTDSFKYPSPILWSMSSTESKPTYSLAAQALSARYCPAAVTIGYQPAYTEFMSTVPLIKGNMQTQLDYWTLQRVIRTTCYRPAMAYMSNDASIADLAYNFAGYQTPQDTQIAWVDNIASSENFICQILLRGSIRRIFSKHAIPSL